MIKNTIDNVIENRIEDLKSELTISKADNKKLKFKLENYAIELKERVWNLIDSNINFKINDFVTMDFEDTEEKSLADY